MVKVLLEDSNDPVVAEIKLSTLSTYELSMFSLSNSMISVCSFDVSGVQESSRVLKHKTRQGRYWIVKDPMQEVVRIIV